MVKWARSIKLMDAWRYFFGLRTWLEDEEFPGKFRTHFFTATQLASKCETGAEEERLQELEDGTARVRPLKPLNPFAARS